MFSATGEASVDFASMNRQGQLSTSGTAMARLMNSGMDWNALRPWVGRDGNTYITEPIGVKPVVTIVNGKAVTEYKPQYRSRLVVNAPSTLLKDEWIQMDTALREVDRAELGAFNAVVSRGLTYNVPGGMGTVVLQGQTKSDIGDATMSMDGRRRGENDRPLYEIFNLPLPLIHKDFVFTMRDVLVSRQKTGTGVDVEVVQDAGRKVLELAEKLTIGTYTYPSYGGGTIYGFTTQPNRLTGSVTAPTTGGWTPETLLGEMLNGRQLMVNAYQRGPIAVFMGTSWMKYLDGDYSAAKGNNTLRQRILAIEGIQSLQTLDYLTGYQIIMCVMNSRNVRMVRFAPLRVIRWEEEGGMELHMKVMMGAVPQFRTDYNSRIGLLHLS